MLLGIDTKYCSDLYMFLIRLNHLIAVLAISEKVPAHSPDTSKWRGLLWFFWWVGFLVLGVHQICHRWKMTLHAPHQRTIKQMESLQKGCLKINETGKTRNREPEVVSLQNDARKRYLKSQLLIKRTSGRIQLSYHEESRRLIKWYRCLKSNVGAKNLCFL